MTKDRLKIRHISVDFGEHVFLSNGVPVKIDPKALEVLQLLVENAGQVVTADAFMDQVWKDKPSAPEVVTSAIARLRKVFKKSGISDELIVTVPKLGYRLELPQASAEPESAAIAPDEMRRQKLPWFSAALVLALLISLAFNLYQGFRQPASINLNGIGEADVKPAPESEVTRIYILRHTEQTDWESEDPGLSGAGIARANYWKTVLQHVEFERIFTTDFTRNIQTADILASDSGLELEYYYPLSFDVLKFLNTIRGQQVLIIGHSNTIPDMINRLIGETRYPPMSHLDYEQLFLITIGKDGDTISTQLHIETPFSSAEHAAQ
ncbi:winged helix-turn-helix domain-containing protein [Elongatibacter sediminis]|uniref:Winged helix-turn-helix domain-containing protein n=1 Tax=Elongatibacter sediminis TaxID=3119006 RepID=A0AAW9RJU0_9GAMM